MLLGFLGSFGHCIGVCGPITVAFSLYDRRETSYSRQQQVWFHVLLNLGRILSYTLVGAGIGALGSVLVAGGEIAGVGSELRRYIALFTGIVLVWIGLVQVSPQLLPSLPLLHPSRQSGLHHRLNALMMQVAVRSHWWTPAFLGMIWGLIPCGFLYIAQVKAAETSSLLWGGATMLSFGIGTLPTMVGVGVLTTWVSADRRSQLFRMGGWVTLIIGILMLFRSGYAMTDYTGHGALICLILALIARPISRFWSAALQYRRAFGVGAFVLSIAHLLHMMEHSWGWKLEALLFMLPQHQWGIAVGAIALVLMAPAAFTSFDWAQKRLGRQWRQLHLLAVPALLLAAIHTVMVGSHYLGGFQTTALHWLQTILLSMVVLGVLLIRWRWTWTLLLLEKWYVAPTQSKSRD